MREEIEGILRTRTRDEWFELLVVRDVCVGKVYEVEEVIEDPQVRHREIVVEVAHPELGTIREFGTAIKLSRTPGSVRRVGPRRGQHTDEVLQWLGVDEARIATPRSDGVVG